MRIWIEPYLPAVVRTHDLPEVYDFLDYRSFLRARWGALQASSATYSYRWFSRNAGLGSPSYLKHVVDGARNLGEATARRFAETLGLDLQQTRYFLALVRMNQASTTEERARCYEELSRFPRYRDSRQLERSQYDYYGLWFCVPIRELVARADFREEPAWIARQLRPPIRPEEARQALELLLDLGLLARDGEGRLCQSEALLTTGPELKLLALRRFHQQMLRRAEEAMDALPLSERQVGGVTLRLTQKQYLVVQQRLYELRQEILQLDGAGEGPEAVHHLAFQLFPLTAWSQEAPGDPRAT